MELINIFDSHPGGLGFQSENIGHTYVNFITVLSSSPSSVAHKSDQRQKIAFKEEIDSLQQDLKRIDPNHKHLTVVEWCMALFRGIHPDYQFYHTLL